MILSGSLFNHLIFFKLFSVKHLVYMNVVTSCDLVLSFPNVGKC